MPPLMVWTGTPLYMKLKTHNVFARRYFYPLLNQFACYQSVAISKPLDVAEKVAKEILTLPIYYDLDESTVERICDVIEDEVLKRT